MSLYRISLGCEISYLDKSTLKRLSKTLTVIEDFVIKSRTSTFVL